MIRSRANEQRRSPTRLSRPVRQSINIRKTPSSPNIQNYPTRPSELRTHCKLSPRNAATSASVLVSIPKFIKLNQQAYLSQKGLISARLQQVGYMLRALTLNSQNNERAGRVLALVLHLGTTSRHYLYLSL